MCYIIHNINNSLKLYYLHIHQNASRKAPTQVSSQMMIAQVRMLMVMMTAVMVTVVAAKVRQLVTVVCVMMVRRVLQHGHRIRLGHRHRVRLRIRHLDVLVHRDGHVMVHGHRIRPIDRYVDVLLDGYGHLLDDVHRVRSIDGDRNVHLAVGMGYIMIVICDCRAHSPDTAHAFPLAPDTAAAPGTPPSL